MAAKSFREIVGLSPSTASTQDSVLVLIDGQNEYADGHLKIHDIATKRTAMASLLTKYRAAHAPLVHILHRTPAGAPVFTPDTPLASPFAELTPQPGEKVIWKPHAGSFSKTDLEEWLGTTGRNKLVLTGYMAHVCVSTTARQADERGFEVVLVEDAIGDRDVPGVKAEELVRVALAELADSFGTVVKGVDVE